MVCFEIIANNKNSRTMSDRVLLSQERQKNAELAAANSKQKYMLRELNVQLEKAAVDKSELERENKRLKRELKEWTEMVEAADPR